MKREDRSLNVRASEEDKGGKLGKDTVKREREGCTQPEKKKRKKERNDRGGGGRVERERESRARVCVCVCVYGAYVIKRETRKSDKIERGEKIDRRTNRLDGEPFETSDWRSSSFGP